MGHYTNVTKQLQLDRLSRKELNRLVLNTVALAKILLFPMKKKFPLAKFSTTGFKSYVVKVINQNRLQTEDVFPVVANTHTKSIQKQIKSKYPEE